VLNWHYSPAALRSISTEVTLRFRLPAPDVEIQEKVGAHPEEPLLAYKIVQEKEKESRQDEMMSGERAKHMMAEIETALGDPSLTDGQKVELKAKYAESKMLLGKLLSDREPGESVFSTSEPPRLVQVRSERVSNEVLRAVMARSGVKIGDTMDETAAKRFAETAASVDEHLRVNFRSDGKGGLVIVLLL
jgi:hypothetical protein